MDIVRKILVIFIFAVVAMFVFGSFFTEQCSEIGECKECWSLTPKSVSSEFCPNPNQTCTAQPYQMQHNALVDLVLCGCAEAFDQGVCLDTDKCSRIKGVVRYAFGYENLEIAEICSNPGLFMTKVSYG